MLTPGTRFEQLIDAIAGANSSDELELLRAFVRVELPSDPGQARLERMIDGKLHQLRSARRLDRELRGASGEDLGEW